MKSLVSSWTAHHRQQQQSRALHIQPIIILNRNVRVESFRLQHQQRKRKRPTLFSLLLATAVVVCVQIFSADGLANGFVPPFVLWHRSPSAGSAFLTAASGNDQDENYENQQPQNVPSSSQTMKSKRKAISALSQPANANNGNKGKPSRRRLSSTPKRNQATNNKTRPATDKRSKRNNRRRNSNNKAPTANNHKTKEQQPSSFTATRTRTRRPNKRFSSKPAISYTSLLPPNNRTALLDPTFTFDDNDPSQNRTPFWEQFLQPPRDIPVATTSNDVPVTERKEPTPTSNNNNVQHQPPLPSIEELFPPTSKRDTTKYSSPRTNQQSQQESSRPPTTPIDGVLPVAELFYKSTTNTDDNSNTANISETDDEELPFSTQQSDAPVLYNTKQQQRRGRRIVRRGMEMLVGGVPICADPPMRSFSLQYDPDRKEWPLVLGVNTKEFGPLLHFKNAHKLSAIELGLFCEYFCHAAHKWDVCPPDLREILLEASRNTTTATNDTTTTTPSSPTQQQQQYELTEREDVFDIEGEFSMDVAIPKHELRECEQDDDFAIFRSVLAHAFQAVLTEAADGAATTTTTPSDKDDDENDFAIDIPSLSVVKSTYGYSHVHAVVKVAAGFDARGTRLYRRVKKISAAFVKAMDGGDIAVSIAEAARNETRWPEELRQRVAEDCLFGDVPEEEEEDEDDEDILLIPEPQSLILNPDSEKFQQVGKADLQRQQELFHGSGKDGVYPDYSAPNIMEAPYQGQIGLRLVDAVVERAKMRQPRVIAIGDVHGCIDELQELLRLCDYRPGDIVLFLGDLVCKGPDSLSVVQMAREIGAIGVRGNHDFEVVRWHQAILAGIDRPVFGSEHFYIATCLSKADLKWLYSLPWFISSKSLDSLFVHAGFVAGIRLSKQNPRLMLNMRSILPDGTVTSKYFTNWPWARLWDGPNTVYFGHDADRGLQQWPNAMGLDTGCVYGGRLTAMILPERRLISTPAKREYFKYRRKHFH